jgi:hypothetical protein
VPSKALRVIVLLTILAVVAIFGWGRSRSRAARVGWQRPVAVVVFLSGDADDAAAASLAASLDAIGARLEEERDRHHGPGDGPPLTFEVLGPLRPSRLPPGDPPGDGGFDRAIHAFELWRAEKSAFAAANGFDPALADVRIHLVAAKPAGETRVAEGIGAAGGEVGVVRASLDAADAFLAATAVVHETFHCLGATDKYDAAGHAIPPEGLAEPERTPPYPQRYAELMVGEVPTSPAAGRLPDGPDELAIGPVTAAEIGWAPAPGAARP